MMRLIRRATLAVTAVALTTLSAGGAHAAAVTTTTFAEVPTLAGGGAICWSSIRTWADTSPDWPGRAIINIQARPASGLGPGKYPLAPLCTVFTTVAWRNTTTGATGAYQAPVVTGQYGSLLYALFQPTGPGHIEVEVTTNNASLPARGAFDVS